MRLPQSAVYGCRLPPRGCTRPRGGSTAASSGGGSGCGFDARRRLRFLSARAGSHMPISACSRSPTARLRPRCRPSWTMSAASCIKTALIRARMVSQPEAPDYDPAEIGAETGITLPALPADWRVADAQIFPVSLRPQRRNCGRNRRARAGVPVRRARAVLRSDCADGRPLGRGGHGLLADRRIRLRAYWRGAGGSPGTGRFSAERQLSLTTPFVLHKERL